VNPLQKRPWGTSPRLPALSVPKGQAVAGHDPALTRVAAKEKAGHMKPEEKAFLASVCGLADKQIAWTRELVAIPTVNPYSGDDSAGSEAPGQQWVETKLQELGAEVRRVPVPPDVYEKGGIIGPTGRDWTDRDNVVGEWVLGNGSGRCIILNDHMDTVGTAGMAVAPYDPVIKDGIMWGRGTTDTKGNLVMGLMAVAALLVHAEGLNGRIVFESVVDEECNGAGAGTLACCLAGIRGDIALCLDGESSYTMNGCNGVVTARVVARGQPGHSSAGVSVNAIDKGVEVKQAIDAFAATHTEAFPKCMVNVGIFRSGTLPAIVPGEAELQMNMTYDLKDAQEAEAKEGHWDGRLFRRRFEAAMSDLGTANDWFSKKPVEVGWIKDVPPYLCPPDEPLVTVVAEAAREAREEDVPVRPMTAWVDGAHLARRFGIPAVGMGAGTPGCAHTATEHVVVADLLKGTKALALAVHRLLSAQTVS